MPVYCYSTGDGRTVDRVFRMGGAPLTVTLEDGSVASRDYRAEQVGRPSRGGWPLECEASGVHPSQAGELREFYERAGVPTEVTERGNPVYRDMHHRRRALRARGLFDRSAFC